MQKSDLQLSRFVALPRQTTQRPQPAARESRSRDKRSLYSLALISHDSSDSAQLGLKESSRTGTWLHRGHPYHIRCGVGRRCEGNRVRDARSHESKRSERCCERVPVLREGQRPKATKAQGMARSRRSISTHDCDNGSPTVISVSKAPLAQHGTTKGHTLQDTLHTEHRRTTC